VVLGNKLVRYLWVSYTLSDLSRHEVADQCVRLPIGENVAEVALPDAEAGLSIKLFEESFALLVGYFEGRSSIRRMQKAGEGLLATLEHFRIVRLDLFLRLAIDLAVMERRAPVRSALKYREVTDIPGDCLDGLHSGRAGPDYRDPLAGEINGVVGPSRRVEGSALK
jgi:hypothetical protein